MYKEFTAGHTVFRAGLEFETGNISSAHRSMNKLCVGIKKGELDLAMLMMPIKKMSFYLTDRVSNYEELEPYFILLDEVPFVVCKRKNNRRLVREECLCQTIRV